MDRARLIRPTARDWDAWVGRADHDFYHLAAYHAFAEAEGEGEAWLALYEDGDRFLAWPYLLRDAGNGYSDATSVYGYSGPVGQGLEDPDFRNVAWNAVRAAWKDQKLAALFTRLHPLLDNAALASGFAGDRVPPGGELMTIGRSVSLDLSHDETTRRALYPQPLRQDVKKAERLGLEVTLDRDWDAFPDFVEQYRATMAKNAASDAYLFSDAYFERLKTALTGIAHLAVARVDGEVAGAMIFTVNRPFAAAHLTGTNPAFNAYSPLKVLIDRTADLAARLGATRLHLGAGRGGHEDSLFSFKSRFSPDRHDFALGRWILDAEAYDTLCAARPGPQSDTFFPAYRAPIPTEHAAE